MNGVIGLLILADAILGCIWIFYLCKLITLIRDRDSSIEPSSGASVFFVSIGHIIGVKWKYDDFQEIASHCVKMRFIIVPFMIIYIVTMAYMFSLVSA